MPNPVPDPPDMSFQIEARQTRLNSPDAYQLPHLALVNGLISVYAPTGILACRRLSNQFPQCWLHKSTFTKTGRGSISESHKNAY